MLGLDGLDPQAVDLLMSEGKLPSFARLRQDGAYGKLRASPPLLSPVLWTTIATGRPALEHGIGHFVSVDPASGSEQPVTSSQRRVKALWNIASDAGQPTMKRDDAVVVVDVKDVQAVAAQRRLLAAQPHDVAREAMLIRHVLVLF